MRGILADINVEGQRDAVLSIWASDSWRDLWNGLGLVVESFPTLGLAFDAPDALITPAPPSARSLRLPVVNRMSPSTTATRSGPPEAAISKSNEILKAPQPSPANWCPGAVPEQRSDSRPEPTNQIYSYRLSGI